MIASPENSPPMVEVKNVSLRFNLVEAVKDVSFHVDRGNIFGLVGSDGAGKSTLLRLIATMIKPSQGEIFVSGLNVVTQTAKNKKHHRLYAAAVRPVSGSDCGRKYEFLHGYF